MIDAEMAMEYLNDQEELHKIKTIAAEVATDEGLVPPKTPGEYLHVLRLELDRLNRDIEETDDEDEKAELNSRLNRVQPVVDKLAKMGVTTAEDEEDEVVDDEADEDDSDDESSEESGEEDGVDKSAEVVYAFDYSSDQKTVDLLKDLADLAVVEDVAALAGFHYSDADWDAPEVRKQFFVPLGQLNDFLASLTSRQVRRGIVEFDDEQQGRYIQKTVRREWFYYFDFENKETGDLLEPKQEE